MNQPSIFIRNHNNNFILVSRAVLKCNLSFTAIGLLVRLLSHKDGYCIHKEVEKNRLRVGDKTFNNAWNELERNGFIVRERIGTGKFIYRWIIINDPELVAKKYVDGNQLESKEPITVAKNPEVDNQERNTIGGNPQVENQERNTSDGNEGTNIDLSNLEERNTDTSNIDVKNVDVSNIEETIQDTPIDYEIVVENNISSTLISKDGKIINNPLEDFKIRVRKYVIDNRINPQYVKDEIESFYNDKKLFNEDLVVNKPELVFDHILRWTEMGSMHNTAYTNSIQNRIIKLIDEYLVKYNINKDLVIDSINKYITSVEFYKIKQHKNPEDYLKSFVLYNKIKRYVNSNVQQT